MNNESKIQITLEDLERNFRQGRSITGAEVPDELAGWADIYTNTFLDYLNEHGFQSIEQIVLLLQEMSYYEHVGDFLGNPPIQLHELAAFGLIVWDRLAVAGFSGSDPISTFATHEQLVECYDYISSSKKATDSARAKASKRHLTNNQARQFVVDVWQEKWKSNKQSKASFARSAVNLVLEKFDIKITEKTIREVWLRDTPSAS